MPFDSTRNRHYNAAAIPDLTHTAVAGTADNTLQDCTGTYTEAVIEANFKDLATKVNQILAALRDAGIIDPD